MSFAQPVKDGVRRSWHWCTSRETRRPRLVALLLVLAAGLLTFFSFQTGSGGTLYAEWTAELPAWLRTVAEYQPHPQLLVASWLVWLVAAVTFVRSQSLALQHSISWSTSTESWHERLAGWAVVGFGALCAWLTMADLLGWTWPIGRTIRMPLGLTVAIWSVWLVGTLVLMRLGLFKLLGPVLFYDMVRSARRSRYFLLRGFYCLVLLLILFFVWMSMPASSISDRERASRMAMEYFEYFSIVQLVAVILLTPAYLAGAISEEKDRKTLEFLLATDLHNREIVLSKLLSRLAHLTLFLLTGLPILGLLQFLGGIDPNLVLAGFGFTMVTMLGIGGFSILNSVVYKRPRDSIAISYLFVVAYMVITSMLFQYHWPAVFRSWPGPAPPPANLEEAFFEHLYIGNIVVLLTKVYRSGVAGSLSADLPALLGEYLLFYGTLAVVCIGWAVLRLRGLALKQTFAKVKLSQHAKERPPVGELPMLWKEIHVEGGLRLNWMACILLALLVMGTFANPFIWLVEWTMVGTVWNERDLSREINIWVRIAGTAVACLTIMGVAIRAANSIGNERDNQTMDGLLSTPLESQSILSAKFVGSLCSVRLGWVWLGSIYTIALCMGGMHLFALPLVLAAWFVFASAAAVIGLGYSMSSHSTLRATVYTVLTCVGLSVGHWLMWFCCAPILFFSGSSGEGAEYVMKFEGGMTPPVVLWFLTFMADDFQPGYAERLFSEMIGFSVFGLFLYVLGTLFYWNGVIVPRFRALTGRTEDARGEGQRPPPVPMRGAVEDDSAVGTPAPDAIQKLI